MMNPSPTLVLLVASAVGIFVLDIFLPLGAAVGMLYAVPVLLSLWEPRRATTIAVALACTFLLTVGFVLSPAGGIPWMILFNRSVSLVVLWVTAVLVLLHKRAAERIKMLQGLLPICAACKKIRDDQNRWTYLEVYIEKHSEAYFTHSICPECAEKYYEQVHGGVE